MQHWKVSSRLMAAFGLVLVMLVAVLTVGLKSLSSVNEDLRVITEVNNRQIELASDLQLLVQERAIATRNIVLITDDAGMARQLERLNAIGQQYSEAKSALGKMFSELIETTQEEKDAFAKIQVFEDKAIPLAKRVADLGLANKNEEATKVMMEELRPAQDAWIASIKNIVDIEQRLNEAATKAAATSYSSALTLMLSLGGMAIVIGIAAALVITRSLTRQLGGEPDEVGRIAGRIASGDLTVHVSTQPGDRTSVIFAMKEMRDSLVRVVQEVRNGTETIATASAQIASGNQDLSSRTEEQASSLEETASSMEELTSTVKQNADNARQANQLAGTASQVAVKGGAVVAQVVETMHSINTSSGKIADIISVIDGIAFQTNILALNAAVEAARAGEQGRGFAVVATEVRNLAQRSAAAAKEIKELIDDSVEKVANGTTLVGNAGATMDEVVGSVRRVTDVMAEIQAASQEQSAGIEQVNQAIGQMDQVTQQNAALVEQAAAAAESLQEQAAKLSQIVSVFKLDGMTSSASRPASVAVKTQPGKSVTAKPARKSVALRPAAKSLPPVASAAAGGEWEEF